jgi:hypothetical protein
MDPKLLTLPEDEKLIFLGVILLIYIVIRIIPLFSPKKQNRSDLPLVEHREYGFAGGTICPKCHRPFSLGVMPLKIGFGIKFAKCEYCGKWSFVQRRSLAELRAAEDAELLGGQPEKKLTPESEAVKTQARLDDSRFTNHL